jgi:tRNA uridine 5-carboxymethylaminomethyl modification enzyme
LDGRTINYKNLRQQHGDIPATPFSYLHTSVPYEVSRVCEDTFERQLRVKNVKYGKFHN